MNIEQCTRRLNIFKINWNLGKYQIVKIEEVHSYWVPKENRSLFSKKTML